MEVGLTCIIRAFCFRVYCYKQFAGVNAFIAQSTTMKDDILSEKKLSKTALLIAEDELKETENNKKQALAIMKSWVEKHPQLINCRKGKSHSTKLGVQTLHEIFFQMTTFYSGF